MVFLFPQKWKNFQLLICLETTKQAMESKTNSRKSEVNKESKRKEKHVKKVIGYHASGPLYQTISWSSLKAT